MGCVRRPAGWILQKKWRHFRRN